MITQIFNGKILLPGGKWINGGSLLIRNGRIADVFVHSRLLASVSRTVNANGGYVMPGGIDIHVHGGGGRDFMEGTHEAFETAVKAHRRHGTTSMFPTLSSSSERMIRAAAATCGEMMEDPSSGVLGLHLEGPYLTPAMAGGQMPELIRLPSPAEYVTLTEDYPSIRRWDAAPELPGANDFARYITGKGVVAGLAHTMADFEAVREGREAGYSIATHFYNAMTTSHKNGVYKHEGTVEAVYLMDGIDVEIIADGIHVPPILMKLVHKVKGTSKMCLVTDALACAASTVQKAFDPRVIIEDGVCKLADHSAIAGSIATMDRLIRTAVQKAEIPLSDAALMVSETPARVMGVYDRKGSLARGKDADIIIMDKDLQLTKVFCMGREIDLTQ